MDTTTARNKARAIESKLLNKIAVRGVTNVAEAVGIDKSQISRWKESLIPRMSMLLAVLEWGIEDEELTVLAKQVARLLTKQKAPTVGAVEASQITIEF
ncbi:MAG: CII family transcriptional regulator [Mixta calida]|uniref:CII family transcriptional regulator n=1 Tax=Mixta calida TaxID=665913 RepID=UPI0029158C67|nr:CII family transcriptional regulator [Mixta calida]MDU4943911.1 CII family transcriptional regulator [Mixta calida]